MPILTSDYAAPGWCRGSHMQTVVPAKLSATPSVTYRREVVETPDGDVVAWDWATPEPAAPDAPLVIHFHGLEGSSRSHYARALMDACVQAGWRGVVCHFRTCGMMNRLPRAYFAGDTADNRWVLETMARRFPNARRYAVGVSLGGNQLAKCLGDIGSDAEGLLVAAASVCAPIDLVAGSERISKGLNVLYAEMFLGTLKEKLLEKAKQYPDLISLNEVRACRTMFDFDEIYTSRIHGFKSAMDYWQKCSARPVLPGVRVPLLLLNARNDPFLPEWVLPGEREISPVVFAEYPAEGGHVGFPEGPMPGRNTWLSSRLMRFFREGV